MMDDQCDAGPPGGPEGTPHVEPGSFSALLDELARAPGTEPGAPVERWPGPGTTIGRFVLGRELGRGGFGVVYEARDQELGRAVAFKLVRPGRAGVGPEQGEEQLRREAEVIARLSHPNLVMLFDVGRCEYGPYLVLELLRGSTLEETLARGPLAPGEAVRLATQIARGLSHAHARGVVHRDLKPSNVFACHDGQVKLLDFGMSHAFGRRRLDGGTPAYMAPEQWRGAPEDERTDVFALGVLLFRMLAGELPFPAEDGGRAIRAGRAAPRLEVPGAPALAELVARMLEQDPTRRPRDASEVLAALEASRGPAPGTPITGPIRTTHRPPPWRAAAVAAAALLAVALAGGWLWRHRQAARVPAIAVMPFVDRGEPRGDLAESAYLGDGLTEELLNLLTRLRALRVVASTSTFALKGKPVTVDEIARRLGVDLVLEGSVRQEPGRLRVSAELVDGRTGFRLWSQIYERPPEELFAVQAEIVQQVAAAAAVKPGAGAAGAMRRLQPSNPAAYDLYLRGRAALRLPNTDANLDRALGLFQQAIALDGDFAPAHAGRCDTWLARYELGRAADAFAEAERACQAARERDPESGEVLVSLGRLHRTSGRYQEAEREFQEAAVLKRNAVEAALGLALTYAAERRPELAEKTFQEARRQDPGDWEVPLELGIFLLDAGRYPEAARAFGEAIALSPDNVSARNNLGVAHYLAGDFEQAVSAWKEALALGPWHGAYSNLGSSYFYLGRYAEAAEMYRKAVELTPDDHRLWSNLGDAYAQVPGREADARGAYGRAAVLAEARLRINPADTETLADLALAEACLGERARALALVEEARRRGVAKPELHYRLALTQVRLGDRDAAVGELERAVAGGYQRRLLPLDAGLAPLRGDPRFRALAGATGR